MSYDLCNENGENFSINLTGWEQVLALAEMYGWHPAGTLSPDDFEGEWDGNYFLNDGQIATAEDAKALGATLTTALDDIPNHDAMTHKTTTVRSRQGISSYVNDKARYSPLEYLSGKGKKSVREFIDFCQRGAFVIW